MTHAMITLYRDIPDDELDELVSLLDDAGLDAEVGPPQVRMGPVSDSVLQMVIEAPIDALIAALTLDAGKRAWRFVTGVLRRDRGDRPKGAGGQHGEDRVDDDQEIVVVIVDPRNKDRIELSRNALDALDALEEAASLPEHPDLFGRPPEDRPAVLVSWDDDAKRWRVR
jgi:hypothetical protein